MRSKVWPPTRPQSHHDLHSSLDVGQSSGSLESEEFRLFITKIVINPYEGVYVCGNRTS